MFVRVWEYEVPERHAEAFRLAYGPDGDWARLFERGQGYLGTSLFHSADGRHSYLTVDRWRAASDWRSFLSMWRAEYEALDARLATLGATERPLLEGLAGGGASGEDPGLA